MIKCKKIILIILRGMPMSENLDEMKEMFYESNIYLLVITLVVSTLHSLFEFLAIKNGIT